MKIKEYWNIVGQIPCLISGNPAVTLHHCHGGSMVERYPDLGRGMAQKPSDWLVIPINWQYHFGPRGVDTGCMSVRDWEATFGSQVGFLAELKALTGIDAVEQARFALQSRK